jgi:hypothetical protein
MGTTGEVGGDAVFSDDGDDENGGGGGRLGEFNQNTLPNVGGSSAMDDDKGNNEDDQPN